MSAKLWSYLPFLLLAVSTLVGVWLVYRHKRDLQEDDEPLSGRDLLRDLERGDAASKMTEAELRRVRELLVGAEAGRATKPRGKPPRREPTNQAARSGHEPSASRPTEPGVSPDDDEETPARAEEQGQ